MLRNSSKKLYISDYEQSYKSMLSVCDLFYNQWGLKFSKTIN